MKRTFRKTISFILTLALLLGTAVVPVSAGPAPEDVTVTSRMVTDNDPVRGDGKQVYKLVFDVYSPYGVKLISTILSYDNTVIVPVSKTTNADFTAPDDGGLFATPLNVLLLDSIEEPYATSARKSYITGDRTAVLLDIYTTEAPLLSMTGASDYFELYFRIADGKTIDDLNVGTFRIETDKTAGSFLREIYPEVYNTEYGLKVDDKNPAGDATHSYPAGIGLTLSYTNSDRLITPTVSAWPTPSAITYGDTLSDSELVGGTASVPGTFSWDSPTATPAVSDSGITNYGVTFTPTETSTYYPVPHPTGLTLTVNPLQVAVPTIKANGTYTGKSQTPDIDSSSYYNVAGSATDAGFYEDGVTVSLSDPANCIWAGGGTESLTLDWTIDPAGYTVEVTTKEIKMGSPNSSLPGAVTTGVNGETPAGQLTWYSSTVARDQNSPIPENFIPTTPLGTYTLWWKFQTTDTNYVSTPKLDYTTITIISGDPQNIEITGKPASAVYGMPNFTLDATVTTTGDSTAPFGEVTWASSDDSVATIDAATGEVDILTAGTTTITASAAAVPGEYAAGTETYELNVQKAPLTVTAGTYTVTKVYDSTVAPGEGSGNISVSGVIPDDEDKMTVVPEPQNYTDENVGGQSTVEATLTIYGIRGDNYVLTAGTIDVPCSITPKPITAVSVDSVTKTYDATTAAGDAVVNGTPTLTGMVEGDDLSIGLTVASFSDANVDSVGKTASITLGAVSGTDAGNYSLSAASPITATANIVPATITGFNTAAPTATILANDSNNTGAASLKANSIVLPTNVTITYAAGTASLPIVWADAQEAYNAKGGTYTYKGTVTNDANFNSYATTLDAVLTVTPVTITGIATVPGTLMLAKNTVLGAGAITDPAMGLPTQVTLSFDNSVAPQDVNSSWDTTLDELKTLAGDVTESMDQTKTVNLTGTNFPAWATLGIDMPFTNLTITDKFVIPNADITFDDSTITFGDVLSQAATVNPTLYPGATATYIYLGTGSTDYGPSATAPVNAGTYSVMATVQNDTHKGTKIANLTINRKVLDLGAIAAIPDQTYTGSPLTPALTATDGSTTLVEGTDYTALYSNNTNAGAETAGVTITGIGNYTGSASKTFTILPKSIAGATITADDQTYTGGPLTPAYMVKDGDTTLVLGTDYTLVGYTGNTNVGTAVINIAGTGNYNETATGQFGINKADYDMSGIDFDDASKEYNGTAQSIAITGTLPTGSDAIQVTVSYSGSATNVSDGPQTITATFATTSPNYNTPDAKTAVLTIIPAEITVNGITADDKVYDGTTDATLDYSSAVLTGKIPADDLGVTATGTFADENVAPAKTVSLSALTLTGEDAGNYVLAAGVQQESATAAITAKEVTVNGITAENKVYDSNTTATVSTSGASFTGKLAGDTLTVSTTGTFADANVGIGKTVTLGALTLGGSDAGNYTLAAAGNQTSTTADITAKQVTVTGITANDKTYDGNTTATLDTSGAAFAGIEAADAGNLTVSATGAFADKNVGSNKTVNLSGLTLGGTSANNYSVKSDSQTSATAKIAPQEITVSGIAADDKVYDSTNTVTLNYSNAILTGKIPADDLGVTATGTFADENVGGGKTVSLSGLNLTGDDVENYVLAAEGQQTTATASITAKEVTVSGITANDKEYDTTTAATVVTGSAVFDGILAGDTLTVSTTGTFADANAGTGKTVTLGALSLGGADAGNYILAAAGHQTTAMADITPKPVTVTGITVGNKVYDGNTIATVISSGAAFAGILDGDTLTVSTTGTFSDKNVGTGKTVTFGTIFLGGASSGNYSVKGDSQTTTAANITAQEVIVSGITADDKEYDTTTAATVNTESAVFTGKLTGDTLTVSTTGTFADANAGTGKTVTLGVLTLGGVDAGNYTLAATGQQATTTADITAKPVTVSGITAAHKIYDSTSAATVDTSSAAFAGILGSDTLTVSTTGTFADKNAGTGKTVTLDTLTLGGASAGNYSVKSDSQATTTANITAKEVTVSGIAAADKIYDGTVDATIDPSGAVFTGMYGGDLLTVSTTGTFADANAATDKTVTLGALTLGGTDAGNYALAATGHQTTALATIHQRQVTISGIGAMDMVYNGGTLTGIDTSSVNFSNKLAGDTLTIDATANFADKHVGTNKTVNLTGLALGGGDAANYILAATGHQTTTTADILAKEVTVTGIAAADKTYDGTTDATIDPSGAAFAGIVGGDTLTVSTTGTFADADAGVAKTVNLAALVLGGADAANYTVKNDSQTTATATIHKAEQAAVTISTDLSAILVGNTLTASAAGGTGDGAITYSVSAGPGAGTFDGSTFTATVAGSASLIATKAASTNYNAANSAPVTVTITNKTDVASRAIVSADITDPAIKAHLVNEGKYTVAASVRKSVNVNEFSVAVKGTAVLTSYESSVPAQGSGQWVGVILGGFKVNGGAAAGTTDLFYSTDGVTYTQLAAGDLAEVQSVGGANGEFILWLKSEAIGAGVDRYIATDGTGTNATKVTVTFTAYVPTGGGGGGGTVTPPAVVNPPVTTGTTTTVTTTVTPVTTGTTSTATVTAQNMNNAVNAAVGASASGGTATNVEIQVNAPQGASEVQVVLPTASVNNLLAQGTTPSLTVTSSVAQVTFDEAALEAITEGAQGQDITIAAKEVDAEVLSDEEKALVGDRPVLDLVVMSGGKVISDFKGGNATVSIPYTLRAGETAQGLTIWFMTDEGQLTEMPCTYDAATGMVTFTTGHFSNYVLGYFPFVDMADSAWYYENGVYAYTNNLISGVSSDRFDPLGKTTRAMVVTILWRLDGKPAAAPNGFKDVPASWYSDAVGWASANGIASGYSSEKFGPNDPITREQMSAIIYNYGVYKGYDMTDRKDLSTFADNAKVSAWAQNSMQWAVEKGIISGTGTGKLDPAGSAQRAQVAAILQRFIENIK